MKKTGAKPCVLVVEEDLFFFEQLRRRLDYLLAGCCVVCMNGLQRTITYARDMRRFNIFRTVIMGTKEGDGAETVARKLARIKHVSPENTKVVIFAHKKVEGLGSLNADAIVHKPDIRKLAEVTVSLLQHPKE